MPMRGPLMGILALFGSLVLAMGGYALLSGGGGSRVPHAPKPAASTDEGPASPSPVRAALPAVAPLDSRPMPAAPSADRWMEEAWERIAALIHPPPAGELEAATGLLAEHRYEEAERAFDRRLVRNPDDPASLFGKAIALLRLESYDDALVIFDHLIERFPAEDEYRLHAARALAALDRRDRAEQALRTVLSHQPCHPAASFDLAVLVQAAGRWRDALVLWQALTGSLPAVEPVEVEGMTICDEVQRRLSPELQAEAWFHRGEVALELARAAEAAACFREYTRRTPADVAGWTNLGIALNLNGERSAALEALGTALGRNPDCVPAWNQTALIHAAIYRDTEDESTRRAILEACERSLSLERGQPRIASLRMALLGSSLPMLPATHPAE